MRGRSQVASETLCVLDPAWPEPGAREVMTLDLVGESAPCWPELAGFLLPHVSQLFGVPWKSVGKEGFGPVVFTAFQTPGCFGGGLA